MRLSVSTARTGIQAFLSLDLTTAVKSAGDPAHKIEKFQIENFFNLYEYPAIP